MECAGNGRALLSPRPVSQPWLVEAVGTAEWTGVPLRLLLAEAGVEPDAVDVVFTGADHGVERGVEQDYQRGLPLDVALGEEPEVLVAYAMNGAPLPPQHGSPLRLVVPGWYGMAHVKWLRDITVIDTPFTGFQQTVAYRIRQVARGGGRAGHPHRSPRAADPAGLPRLHVPDRVVARGRCRWRDAPGRDAPRSPRWRSATDDGRTWRSAELEPDQGHRWAWRRWSAHLVRRAGRPRPERPGARRRAGNSQPLQQPWNRGGFANNLVQRVPVFCPDPADITDTA